MSHRPVRREGGGGGSVERMNRRRAALVIVASTALALGLSGCEKPNPGASVFSGTTTQFQRAAVLGVTTTATLDASNCAQDAITAGGRPAATITADPRRARRDVGISVDPVVADAGWFPVSAASKLTTEPITSTYYRFNYPGFDAVPADGLTLQVVAGDGTQHARPVGLQARAAGDEPAMVRAAPA